MARFEPHLPPPRFSVLDRLLENADLADSLEARDGRAEIARLRDLVRRDLAWLLNARTWRVAEDDEANRELRGTIHRFGLPDMTTLDLKNDDEKQLFADQVTEAIERFEPRLERVEVTPGDSVDAEGRTKFHIDAWLNVEPAQQLSFETTVLWRNRLVEVAQR